MSDPTLTDDEIRAGLKAANSGKTIPQWAAVGAFVLVSILCGVVWTSLAGDIAAKADASEVAQLAEKVERIEDDVDYLSRKAEADLVNDAVNRRILNELAVKAGAAPGGELEKPRPPARHHEP
jgi:hypothetical protein